MPTSRFFNYVYANSGEIGKFIIVGITTMLINIFSVYALYGVLREDYREAVTISYIITVCFHFFLNKFFTFDAAAQKLRRNTPRYGMMLLLNYFITIVASWLTVGIIGSSPYVGVVAATGGSALMSFFIMKYFVFSGAAEPPHWVDRPRIPSGEI
jgi:putative flippase GtrA